MFNLSERLFPKGSAAGDKFRRLDLDQIRGLGPIANAYIHASTEEEARQILTNIWSRERLQRTVLLGSAGLEALQQMRYYSRIKKP